MMFAMLVDYRKVFFELADIDMSTIEHVHEIL